MLQPSIVAEQSGNKKPVELCVNPLVSLDDFKNTTATITDNGDWGEIYKPKNFRENGNTSTFTDGTGVTTIRVTRKGSGVMGIYTSDAFDTLNFPDYWKDLWQDEWEGRPWEDDWWQSIWQEFEITFPQLDEKAQKKWPEKLYADEKTAFFSSLTDCMDKTEPELWLDRALEDGNWAFQSMLYDKLNRDDEFDEQKEKLEKDRAKAQAAEYKKAGVTMVDEKTCYYQGQLINVFLDIQKEGSFCTLNMNPKGTVNIKLSGMQKTKS